MTAKITDTFVRGIHVLEAGNVTGHPPDNLCAARCRPSSSGTEPWNTFGS
jgi:hypothetical protein